jgi:MFS family permease
MNTQNTTVHIRLWNRAFWQMAIANFLLCASVTMLIPTLPSWLLLHCGLSDGETGVAMAVFAIGLFLPGPFCSFLVQHYRRNFVCMWAVFVLAGIQLALYYLPTPSFLAVLLLRLVQGAAFGLAQMVLTSTLIIDTAEAYHRTEANHSATWFGRFALSIGPLAGLLVAKSYDFHHVLWLSAACCVAVILLIASVHFPFRVPTDKPQLFSCDRFFLCSVWPLWILLLLVMTSVGLMLSLPLSESFYGALMVGFFLALLAQHFVFADAELKSEVVTGLLLLAMSQLILLSGQSSVLCSPMAGLGIGVVGARFLLFFIKLSHHCQRGTSQSTFMLGWESGLALGVGLGYLCFADSPKTALAVALTLCVGTLLVYVLFVHSWFVRHKNR